MSRVLEECSRSVVFTKTRSSVLFSRVGLSTKCLSVSSSSFWHCSFVGLVWAVVGAGTIPPSVTIQLIIVLLKLKSPRRMFVVEVLWQRYSSIFASIGRDSSVSVSGGRYATRTEVSSSSRVTIRSSQTPLENFECSVLRIDGDVSRATPPHLVLRPTDVSLSHL